MLKGWKKAGATTALYLCWEFHVFPGFKLPRAASGELCVTGHQGDAAAHLRFDGADFGDEFANFLIVY